MSLLNVSFNIWQFWGSCKTRTKWRKSNSALNGDIYIPNKKCIQLTYLGKSRYNMHVLQHYVIKYLKIYTRNPFKKNKQKPNRVINYFLTRWLPKYSSC